MTFELGVLTAECEAVSKRSAALTVEHSYVCVKRVLGCVACVPKSGGRRRALRA